MYVYNNLKNTELIAICRSGLLLFKKRDNIRGHTILSRGEDFLDLFFNAQLTDFFENGD